MLSLVKCLVLNSSICHICKEEFQRFIHLVFLHLLGHLIHVSIILCYERSHYAIERDRRMRGSGGHELGICRS